MANIIRQKVVGWKATDKKRNWVADSFETIFVF